MKPKKTKKANLEKFRTIFFQVGMILTLSAILLAFEWKSPIDFEPVIFDPFDDGVIEIIIPNTTQEDEKADKVEPPSFKLKVVEDESGIIEDDLTHLISEIGELDGVKIIEYVDPTETIVEEFVKAEFMPTFQGKDGIYFRNYVASKVKFPDSAIESGITGTVFASFVIDEKGKVIKTRITRSVHPEIDKAVLDAIEESPDWEPGINNGEFVRVKYSIAIAFQLQ